MDELQSIIARLGLGPLPLEGGWFRRYFLSPVLNEAGRSRASAIHFLLSPEGFSAMHRLQTDETWTFKEGAPVEMLLLAPDGGEKVVRLGNAAARGQQSAITVSGGHWQGARTLGAWSLVDCAMAPAWDERELELGAREELVGVHPAQAELIRALTR